ncbi:cytochrome P450 [Rhizopogon vinicolor AM-OR11-026]|uniref:Cytochrome P450 n=1 Tax=Rhizopogon vinicolor AM-OR11-026 TaxID=1314800 RepID=A0A1B7MWM5_9AGAM|nr:cytochrome P450 [Rhizopogon vinicolor AM-OR11-026]
MASMLDLFRAWHWQIVAVIFSLLVLVVYSFHSSRTSSLRLPPGPSESPLGHHGPRKIAQWINEYGPVISLNKGKDVLVVVGRYQEAIDIMEKQGASLADRPRSVAGSEILGRGMRFVQIGSGDRIRKFRKASHTHLQLKSAQTYELAQFAYARDIILDLLDSPRLHQLHIKRFAASVILRIVYGKTTPTLLSDPFLLQLQKMIPRVQSAMMPGTYLVDKYPILKYIPGYGRNLLAWREEEYEMLSGKLNWVKNQVESNVAADSIAKDLLVHRVDNQLSEMEMTYLSGSLIGAGADTTAVAISTVMMAAACFPQPQARVHEELEAVVGRETPPTFEDWSRLVQLQAFILEALRWRPVNPIGLPHRASKDIIWNGMCIPAGATVFGNHWSISRDPDVYHNPEVFDPQRWIGTDGEIKDNMRLFTFGFGRRACPGLHVANRSVYIAAALVLWSFTVAEDPGNPIDDTAFVPGIVSHQKPFSLVFKPRMSEASLKFFFSSTAV